MTRLRSSPCVKCSINKTRVVRLADAKYSGDYWSDPFGTWRSLSYAVTSIEGRMRPRYGVAAAAASNRHIPWKSPISTAGECR